MSKTLILGIDDQGLSLTIKCTYPIFKMLTLYVAAVLEFHYQFEMLFETLPKMSISLDQNQAFLLGF